MARTVDEIKREMTDAFMADPVIREKYQLKDGDTFRSAFSLVSLENILFFTVAAAHHVMERLFEGYREELDEQLRRGIVATVPWYYQKALEYQHGHALRLDEKSRQWGYAQLDEAARLVKFAAVRDLGGSIQILVAGADKDGLPEALSKDNLRAFESYINALKPAGTILSVRSVPADRLKLSLTLWVDPLLFDPSGRSFDTGEERARAAIIRYLGGITFGGAFNKNKLIDALQAVPGVRDVSLSEVEAAAHDGELHPITGLGYTSYSGCFLLDPSSTLTYVL